MRAVLSFIVVFEFSLSRLEGMSLASSSASSYRIAFRFSSSRSFSKSFRNRRCSRCRCIVPWTALPRVRQQTEKQKGANTKAKP
jgi:hypothetical protein